MSLAQHRPADWLTVGCGRWNENDAYKEGCISEAASWHQWVNAAGQNLKLVWLNTCVHMSAYFCGYRRLREVIHEVEWLFWDPRSPLILLCHYLPLAPSFSVSPGISPVDGGPSGQSLRRDTRSAWCSGQTLQQRFLCSTHLLVLAHSSGPQHRSGQALANTLVQQPDHFAQDFSVSTVGSN